MTDFPIKAEVHCSDGVVGRSTYVIGNPLSCQITHLVVQSILPPLSETLVPVDQVEEITDNRIKLKCTRNELNKMEPFKYEEYIRTEMPGFIYWPFELSTTEHRDDKVVTYIPEMCQNIPPGEFALHRSARVEATDGYVGQVDELLINSNNMQVTHLVLRERHIFQQREITIPISQINRVSEDKIYLKLDRQTVEKLPTTPTQRRLQKGFQRQRFFL